MYFLSFCIHFQKLFFVELCPYRDSSLGNRDPYIGILIPTRDPPSLGNPRGNLVLHRNPVVTSNSSTYYVLPRAHRGLFGGKKIFGAKEEKIFIGINIQYQRYVGIPYIRVP